MAPEPAPLNADASPAAQTHAFGRYPELACAIADMQSQPDQYRPTTFWHDAAWRIAEALCENGIEQFRRLPESLAFFVPTYGPPGNGFSDELCQRITHCLPENAKIRATASQFLSGESAALADFRVLEAAGYTASAPYLQRFSESSYGSPIEQFEFEGRRFSRSSLNYLLGMALLNRHLGKRQLETVLEIGGGFGTLGEILLSCQPGKLRYIDLDIPPVQYVAQCYLTAVLGPARVSRYVDTATMGDIPIDSLREASTLCSWQIERLRGRVDLFVNYISFQEMEPAVVQNYLHHVDRLEPEWMLLRNMREGKQLKGGAEPGVEQPIRSSDYLAMLPNYSLREASVLPFGHRTVDGYHSELMILQRRQDLAADNSR